MRPGLSIGDVGRLSWTVVAQHAIHLGEDQLPHGQPGAVVFSTPNMVMLMERAAKAALRPYLEPGEESVGVVVHVEHLAATPIGANVHAEARVTAISGSAVDFDIAAFDALEPIGRGTHRRAVIKLDRMRQRLGDKVVKMPQAALLPPEIKPAAGELPEFTTLRVRPAGEAVLKVTLNRPAAQNAVNVAMTGELEKLVGWLAGHPEVRIVVIGGAGRVFCGGEDGKELATLDAAAAAALSHRQARLWLAMECLPQVVIAAVNGAALGAGCVAAIGCDFRIASTAAAFGMPEISRGWTPGYGLAQLTALIGKARALEWCLTGATWTAQQAMEQGLVHRVVPAGQLERAADELVSKLLAMPAEALRLTKQVIHRDEGMQPKSAYLNDTAAYLRCLGTADAKEGLAAFNEDRPPRFKGR